MLHSVYINFHLYGVILIHIKTGYNLSILKPKPNQPTLLALLLIPLQQNLLKELSKKKKTFNFSLAILSLNPFQSSFCLLDSKETALAKDTDAHRVPDLS